MNPSRDRPFVNIAQPIYWCAMYLTGQLWPVSVFPDALYPPPDALDENSIVDLFLALSSTAWSGSPLLPSPPHLPPIHVSSPIHFPTTILPNSPNKLYLTPNSLFQQHRLLTNFLPPSASTSSHAVPFTHKSTLLSPRIRKPWSSTRMITFSSNSNTNAINPPHLINNNTTAIPPSPPMTPILTSTPIPMPPTFWHLYHPMMKKNSHMLYVQN